VKKIFGLFLLVVLSVTAYAVPVFPGATVKDTLVLWTMDEGVNSGFALQKITRRFTQQSKVPVKVRFLNWGVAYNELTRALSMDSAAVVESGTEIPDVIQLGSSWVPTFGAQGLISTVDSLLDVADTTRFYSEAMKSTHVGHGKATYALPWFLDVRGLFVNERLWLSMGFNDEDVEDFPKFFGSLRAIAKDQFKNDAGNTVAPFEFGVHEDWSGQQQMAPILWSFGGDIVVECPADSRPDSLAGSLEKSCYRSALADSLSLVGLRHYLKVLRDEEIAPNSLHDNSSQSADRFIRSELMMIFGTSEIIRKIEFGNDLGGLMESPLAKDGIAVVPAPKGPNGRFTFVGGSHLALPRNGIYKGAERRRLAIGLFLHMLRADNVDYYSHQIGFLPADKGLMRLWAKDSRYYQLINGLEKDGRSFVNIPEWRQIEVAVNDMVNRIGKILLDRESDPSDGIARQVLETHKKINGILNYNDPADPDSLWACVKLSMLQPVEEFRSELLEAPEEPETPLFAIVVAVVAVIVFIVASVLVFRRKL